MRGEFGVVIFARPAGEPEGGRLASPTIGPPAVGGRGVFVSHVSVRLSVLGQAQLTLHEEFEFAPLSSAAKRRDRSALEIVLGLSPTKTLNESSRAYTCRSANPHTTPFM